MQHYASVETEQISKFPLLTHLRMGRLCSFQIPLRTSTESSMLVTISLKYSCSNLTHHAGGDQSSKWNKFKGRERTQSPNITNPVSQKQTWPNKCKSPRTEITRMSKEYRCMYATHITEAPGYPRHVSTSRDWCGFYQYGRPTEKTDRVPLTFVFKQM